MAKEAATIELVWDLVRGRTEGISKVDYFPQKPAFPKELPYEQPFLRATPESQGISSRQVETLFRELEKSRELHMHNVMILRNGKVIGEANFYPYRSDLWHFTYSMSKSVVSMAVGFLIAEEKLTLDTKIVDIFRKNVGLFSFIRQKDLTVRHLLTMTSGVSFNETGAISGNDWVKGYLEAFCHHEPGEFFEYNSMNTYMLSAAVTEVAGEPLVEYLRPRLFTPLGITRVFWETCPKGNNKGGWGLFLCAEDMAKLGQLYLDGGKWNGQQIIPEEWVKESVSAKVVPPEETGFPGYGYQIWSCKREGQFAFNGMLGQNVFVYPDVNMVVVTTAGNEVLFNSNKLQEVLEENLPPEGEALPALPENPEAYRKLKRCQWEIAHPVRKLPRIQSGGWSRERRPSVVDGWGRGRCHDAVNGWSRERRPGAMDGWGRERCHDASDNWRRAARAVLGRRFAMEATHVGLFPLVGQVFHNNYTEGIRELGFHMEDGKFFLDVREGEMEHVIPVGFAQAEISTLDLHGEPYLIAVEGRFTADEDGRLVLAVTVSYLEEAIKRRMKIFFDEQEIEVRFGEVPGKKIILDGLASVTSAIVEMPIVRRIQENGNVDLIRMAMENTIEPTLHGKEMIG